MKKTILAIAIPALFASTANAAVIYDKDGTQVGITGNLRTQFASDHDREAEDLAGRARIGLSTKVALNDTWSGLAKGEWQLTSNKSKEGSAGDDITSREVYVGLDGSQFGMIRFGQLDTVFNDVINTVRKVRFVTMASGTVSPSARAILLPIPVIKMSQATTVLLS